MNFCIVIPYRNREAHLKKFIRHYANMLRVPIFVIEQGDDKHFNRGKLANVGFLEEAHKFDYFIFHDVDMYLYDENYHVMDKRMKRRLNEKNPPVFYGTRNWNEGLEAYFRFPETPALLATHCSQFSFQMPYPQFMGGITAFSTKDFKRFKGFRNNIWSWGNEDDALYKDIVDSGLTIEKRDCWYMCEDHERTIIKEPFKEGRKNLHELRTVEDTVWSCKYDVTDRKDYGKYVKITVNL